MTLVWIFDLSVGKYVCVCVCVYIVMAVFPISSNGLLEFAINAQVRRSQGVNLRWHSDSFFIPIWSEVLLR